MIDHHYKRNKSLPAMEQMISANPDVTTCDLTPDLEFIVMACDGIWNSMSSQQAIDFVKSRLSEDIELSNICEQVRNLLFFTSEPIFYSSCLRNGGNFLLSIVPSIYVYEH